MRRCPFTIAPTRDANWPASFGSTRTNRGACAWPATRGVPVAYQVAQALHLPLDVFLVRKLGVPGHEELATPSWKDQDDDSWRNHSADASTSAPFWKEKE
jgi:hypothetical protein